MNWGKGCLGSRQRFCPIWCIALFTVAHQQSFNEAYSFITSKCFCPSTTISCNRNKHICIWTKLITSFNREQGILHTLSNKTSRCALRRDRLKTIWCRYSHSASDPCQQVTHQWSHRLLYTIVVSLGIKFLFCCSGMMGELKSEAGWISFQYIPEAI